MCNEDAASEQLAVARASTLEGSLSKVLNVLIRSLRKTPGTACFTDPDGESRLPGFHDLRRTFARMADRAGVAHRTIKEIAGWKNNAH